MGEPIIKVENLGKQYILSHEGPERYTALRDVISRKAKGFLKKGKQTDVLTPSREEFWALKDVSFEINEGEAVGIIGRNGAGKSTLLKVLSRITEPTTGKIEINGRVASLLEVGTGFHPELTGRENIFLNGAILGMSQAEIRRKFDEIVDFAGVEKFLDTPVKRYSSGMFVRLAFAVAAHLEPEILVVDEVLAVGDAEFQKKCLGKMNEVSKSGRTVLFVSHDINAIQRLCTNSILLSQGKIIKYDRTENVIPVYLKTNDAKAVWNNKLEKLHPHFVSVSNSLQGQQPNLKLRIEFVVKSSVSMKASFVAFNISNSLGTMIGQAIPRLEPFVLLNNEEKKYVAEIDVVGFIPDDYIVSAWIGPHYTETYDWQKDITTFHIIESPQSGRTYPHPSAHGAIVPSSRIIE